MPEVEFKRQIDSSGFPRGMDARISIFILAYPRTIPGKIRGNQFGRINITSKLQGDRICVSSRERSWCLEEQVGLLLDQVSQGDGEDADEQSCQTVNSRGREEY